MRDITDALDAVGNTTKALTKGYAIGSAALAAFLLFSAYLDEVKPAPRRRRAGLRGRPSTDTCASTWPTSRSSSVASSARCWSSSSASLAIRAVGRAAGDMIEEVRRQFREEPGIMAGTSTPDYARV